MSERPALTLPDLGEMKRQGRRIAALTAYDAAFARAMDAADVDLILVGDSLGMAVQGHDTTLPVTLEQMIYHAASVRRGANRAFLVVDLPFMSYASPARALDSAARLLREGGAQMVKLEGGERRAEAIRALANEDIPVCAHLGLLPQSVHRLGGYRVQARDPDGARRLREEALLVQEAGAALLVLECVPAELAGEITAALRLPTIGIGAGPACDGQVLVCYDLIGLSPRLPRFCQDFLRDTGDIRAAFAAYVEAVRAGRFPGPGQAY